MSLTQDKYNTLATLLHDLRSSVAAHYTLTELRQALVTLQQFFSEQIVSDASDDAHEAKFRTEISKQLRLLDIDITFLAGARTEATVQTRRNTILERLMTLISYCEAVTNPPNKNSQ